MDPVSSVYIAFMAIGVLWIIWRIVVYLRIQRRREFLWDKLTYDEHFMNFLERMKSQEGEKAQAHANEEIESDSQGNAKLNKSEGEP